MGRYDLRDKGAAVTLNEIQHGFIKGNMPLAMSIARKVYNKAPHALELDEMRALAFWGLVDAASRWFGYCEKSNRDPKATQFFTKYASLRIEGAVTDRIRSNDWATRSLRDKSKKIHAISDFEHMTHLELAELTGMSEKEVRDTLTGISRAPVSLDSAPPGDGETDNTGLQPAEAEDVESVASVHLILDAFADAVRDLPFEERVIVVLHYHQQMQLKKVAEQLGITDAQASTLHTSGVLKLLKVLKSVSS